VRIRDTGPARKPARSRPSARQRWFLFVLGALLGGVLGYGYLTSGPGPAPSLLTARAAPWIVVPAVLLGILAARYPDAVFLRPGGRFRWHHDDDD
jgi:hypothetical protein